MYRYLLFYCDTYYPSGGMKDCILKTNNFDDLEQTVREKFEDDFYLGTISYYDAAEDKYFYADMKLHKDKDYFDVYKFYGWKEEPK